MIPAVEITGVRKSFGDFTALHEINLSIAQQEFVSLLGASGCGKTTLLHCLSGLDDFDDGEVVLAGTSLRQLDDDRKTDFRARQTGFVFQSYNLLPVLNARENVELPLLLTGISGREASGRALDALDAVGLADRANHRPNALSGGQQQRVAIARALVHDPLLILADEPTGNLDSDTSAQVLNLLDSLTRQAGKTMLMVTHSPDVVGLADRVLCIREGHLEEVKR